MPVISDELTLYKCYFFLILGGLCRYECHYGNLRVWEGVRFLLKIDPRRDGIERHLSVDGFAEGDTETAGRSPEDARRVHQVAEEHTRAPGPRPALSRRLGHCPVSLRNAKNHNHSGPRNPPRSPLRRFQTADVNVKKEKKKKGRKERTPQRRTVVYVRRPRHLHVRVSSLPSPQLFSSYPLRLSKQLCFSHGPCFWKLLLVNLFGGGDCGLWLSPWETPSVVGARLPPPGTPQHRTEQGQRPVVKRLTH